MNSDQIGALAEAKVLNKLLHEGYIVSRPWSSCPYDFITDKDGELLKVQVKTGRYRKGVVKFKTCSVNRRGGRISYKGKVDLFMVYCPELDSIYKVPVDDVGATEVLLRVEPPKKKDSKVKWAKEFEI